jgi:tungstate transport system ATP-binding protein
VNPETLAFHNLEMRFGRRRLFAVDGLELNAGECTILSGKNGAGKSTLLRIMAGLQRPSEGTVSLDGHMTPWRRARQALRDTIVYLHQHAYMFDQTVAENVAYGLQRTRLHNNEVQDKVAGALAWCGLTANAAQNARTLSGGERQKVALARARVLGRRWVLLDEPTSNLDDSAREQTYFLIRGLISEGVAVVVATHERELMTQLGDRRLKLEDGKLVLWNADTPPGSRIADVSVNPLGRDTG